MIAIIVFRKCGPETFHSILSFECTTDLNFSLPTYELYCSKKLSFMCLIIAFPFTYKVQSENSDLLFTLKITRKAIAGGRYKTKF